MQSNYAVIQRIFVLKC